ncbi:ABC transporter ATP-binding protein [bacterium]|nr:ABC transporter ATP-binding protein [bacterium]
MTPANETSIPVLELRGISKIFPDVIANENVDFTLYKGEIHTLLGENGAGKSTLMNVISGLYPADAGEMFLNGEKVRFTDPSQAIERGIGMVHQHFMLIKNMTVAENIILGTPQRFHLNMKKIHAQISDLSSKYGLMVDPARMIQDLTVGEQQRVEILKVLYRGANILILDEPTAVLSPQESDSLFEIIDRMLESGRSVIFISHKMKEVMAHSIRITILGRGKVLAVLDQKDTSAAGIAKIMMGQVAGKSGTVEPKHDILVAKPVTASDAPVIKLENVCATDERGHQVLDNINLELKAGEILGMAGISGNGQTVLAKVLGGLHPFTSGTYTIEGKPFKQVSVTQMLKMGMGYIPEDRKKYGIAKGLTIGNNFLIRDVDNPSFYNARILNWKSVFNYARGKMKLFDIRAASEKSLVGNLSGGNIQKMILSREISRPIKFLVANQPIRGLDINASQDIQAVIRKAKKEGLSVLLISEDLDELLLMSDRICVMYNGRIIDTMPTAEATIERIGLLMTGIRK